jgi:ATP/maltotriose-dependent transcriptional regulator MalT
MADCGKLSALTRTIHEYLLCRPIFSPRGTFLVQLLDGLQVRLRQPYVREAPAGFGRECLATAFMNTPSDPNSQQAACLL